MWTHWSDFRALVDQHHAGLPGWSLKVLRDPWSCLSMVWSFKVTHLNGQREGLAQLPVPVCRYLFSQNLIMGLEPAAGFAGPRDQPKINATGGPLCWKDCFSPSWDRLSITALGLKSQETQEPVEMCIEMINGMVPSRTSLVEDQRSRGSCQPRPPVGKPFCVLTGTQKVVQDS